MSVLTLIPLGLLAASPNPQPMPSAVTELAPLSMAASPPIALVAMRVAVPDTVTAPPAQPDTPISPDQPKGRIPHAKGDPLEGFNRAMFSVNTALDKALFRPAAMGYKHIVPKPARSGLRNAFSNLTEPVAFLNDVLQLKPGNAFRTFTRFLINSVFGVAGLFDVARHEGLPHRANGLGNTFGRYGIKSGPYLFLPLLGPSSLRDLAGGTVDGLVVPTAVGTPFDRTDYQIGKAVVTGLDTRAEVDSELKTLYDTALDPYATLRSVYLQSRAADIAGITGKTEPQPDDALEDPLQDPAASTAPSDGMPVEQQPRTSPEAGPQP